jgi:nucleoside-diphosphate-sugar epimerase
VAGFTSKPFAYAVAVSALLSCLIVGCGYVGTRLARQEVSRRSIRAIVRSAANSAALRAGEIDTLQIDLDRGPGQCAEMLARAADGAALVYLVPPPEQGEGDARLAALLESLGDARPAVFVYISTTGVYGDRAGAVVDERTPVAPTNARSRRRVAAETLATQWGADRGVRCVVLRVPGIYGPHRLPLERLQRGEPALRPEDAGPGNRIHVDDLVAAIVTAIDRPQARGVYNVCDGDHASTTVFLQETARAAGLPAPSLISRKEAAARISPGMLAFLLESRRVDSNRMRDELGVQPRYPAVATGIRASLAEMEQENTT